MGDLSYANTCISVDSDCYYLHWLSLESKCRILNLVANSYQNCSGIYVVTCYFTGSVWYVYKGDRLILKDNYTRQLVHKLSNNKEELLKYIESMRFVLKDMEQTMKRDRTLLYFVLALQFAYLWMKG